MTFDAPTLLTMSLALINSLGLREAIVAFVIISLAYSTYRMFFKS